MSEDRHTEAARRLTESFGESYLRGVQNAVDAQQRGVNLAQGWVQSLTDVLESQAETNRALTRAMDNFANVVGEAVESQERTARALTESLDAYRDVVERANETQRKNEELVENMLGGVVSELQQQSKGNEQMIRELMESSGQQTESFQKLLVEAAESYARFMTDPFTPPQENQGSRGSDG